MDTTPYEPNWKIGRVLVSTLRWSRLLALCLIFGMMFLGFIDVIMRYFLNMPIMGAKEVQTYLIPIVVALCLGATQFDKKHIRMEIIYDRLPRRGQVLAEYLALLLSLFIWVVITWQTIVTGNHYAETGRIINMIKVPLAYVQYVVAFGAALLCLETVRHLVCLFTRGSRKADAS